MNRKLQEQVEKSWRSIIAVWIALLGALVVYFVAAFAFKGKIPPFKGNFLLLRGALYAVSIATLLLIWVIRKTLLVKIGRRAVNRDAVEKQPHPVISGYATVMTVCLAMAESIGIYGLILSLFSKDFFDLYCLMVLSAAAMVYFRPKKEELMEILKKNVLTHDVF